MIIAVQLSYTSLWGGAVLVSFRGAAVKSWWLKLRSSSSFWTPPPPSDSVRLSAGFWSGGEMSPLQNYRSLQTDFLEDDHERVVSVTSLSVQLFTVPTVVSTGPSHSSLFFCVPPPPPDARTTSTCRTTTWRTTTTVSSPSQTCRCKCSPSRRWWVPFSGPASNDITAGCGRSHDVIAGLNRFTGFLLLVLMSVGRSGSENPSNSCCCVTVFCLCEIWSKLDF